MSKCETAIPLEEQIRYLNSLCDALNHAHKHGVYHRNLKPETVYITNMGVVKLADFDFAKLIGRETISVANQLLVDNFLTAPELLFNSSKASPVSDIYSLGCLWYLLSVLPQHPVKIEIEKVDRLNLTEPARELIKKMLDKVPENRPKDISGVQKSLKQIITS